MIVVGGGGLVVGASVGARRGRGRGGRMLGLGRRAGGRGLVWGLEGRGGEGEGEGEVRSRLGSPWWAKGLISLDLCSGTVLREEWRYRCLEVWSEGCFVMNCACIDCLGC